MPMERGHVDGFASLDLFDSWKLQLTGREAGRLKSTKM